MFHYAISVLAVVGVVINVSSIILLVRKKLCSMFHQLLKVRERKLARGQQPKAVLAGTREQHMYDVGNGPPQVQACGENADEWDFPLTQRGVIFTDDSFFCWSHHTLVSLLELLWKNLCSNVNDGEPQHDLVQEVLCLRPRSKQGSVCSSNPTRRAILNPCSYKNVHLFLKVPIWQPRVRGSVADSLGRPLHPSSTVLEATLKLLKRTKKLPRGIFAFTKVTILTSAVQWKPFVVAEQ